MSAGTTECGTRPRLLWLWLWLLLSALVVFNGRELFRVAVYEEGDIAANGLNIERARHGRELHGNYSRFNFNHPGPAFFYVYAAGEWLLCDALSVVPARHNAHLIAGAVLQALFLAAAIALLAGASSRPYLAAALLGSAALVHFAHVPVSFFNIWPPFVLMLPFACFVVSAAMVSATRWEALPWFVLSGGFLVHGHVAQVLFVGVLGGAALFVARCAVRRLATPEPANPQPWLCWVLLALFALPLVLDVFAGRQSNFYRLVRHAWSFSPVGRPDWLTSIGFTFSYFGYAFEKEVWFGPEATGTWPGFWAANRLGLLVSAISISSTIAALWLSRRDTSVSQVLIRRLALFIVMAFLVSVLWAKRQDAGITDFNSHFLFGLVFLVATPALFIACEYWARLLRWLTLPALAAAACVFVSILKVEPAHIGVRAREIDQSVERILGSVPSRGRIKGLVFGPDNWYDAVTIAAALQRHGVGFRVPPPVNTMFGRDHVLHSGDNLAQAGTVEWWRIVPADKARPGDIRVGLEASLRRVQPDSLPPMPATLVFSPDGNSDGFKGFGIGRNDPRGFSLTEASIAVLHFAAPPVERDVEVTFDVAGVRPLPREEIVHSVVVYLNHRRVGAFTLDSTRSERRLRILASDWNAAAGEPGGAELLLDIPTATVPSEVRWSGDHRQLGLALYRVIFAEAK